MRTRPSASRWTSKNSSPRSNDTCNRRLHRGDILGSSQVRVEHRGEVWVTSGDYKTDPDRTCTPFELVRCHTFVTESTFGLPIYRWTPEREVFDEIRAWWATNAAAGRASV